MTEETKVIKRFKPFILGKCQCGCGNDIKIITSIYQKGLGYWLKKYVLGHNPRNYPKNLPTREKHWRWKGGVRRFGKYITLRRKHHKYCDNDGYVLLHRYRMELMLGRYLTRKEVVHHISTELDENGLLNNDEDNLMLFASNSEHKSYELTKDMSRRICVICGACKTWIKITKEGKKYHIWHGDGYDKWLCTKCHHMVRYWIRKFSKI